MAGHRPHLPGEPVAGVMLPSGQPEAGLLIALHQGIVDDRQPQPCRVGHIHLSARGTALIGAVPAAVAVRLCLDRRGRAGGGLTAPICLRQDYSSQALPEESNSSCHQLQEHPQHS